MILKKVFATAMAVCCMAGSYVNSSVIALEETVPEFTDEPYVTLNGNQPEFTETELTTEAFENYSDLDDLGRCGVASANVCTDIMPTEERGEIGMIKPSGWQSVKYDCVDGKYLYNRCHLIGYQLAGENANEKNLITGTRYLNINGMLPFENMVDDYVEDTDNHVLYRVTPDFEGDNLVASGVQMEAYSVEDDGEGICYNVYCYNAQPNISIDYATGASTLAATSKAVKGDANGDGKLDVRDAAYIAQKLSKGLGSTISLTADYNADGKVNVRDAAAIAKKLASVKPAVTTRATSKTTAKTTKKTTHTTVKPVSYYYILNTNSKVFHLSTCGAAKRISAKNRKDSTESRDAIISQGYKPCGKCNP